MFDTTSEAESDIETSGSITKEEKSDKPLTKDEFVKVMEDYSKTSISVPKILIQTTSEVRFTHFNVERNITDFEVAKATIERFDAVNKQLLSVVDAQVLEVDDARNTLACLLLDSISELSYDDADFIIDVVEQYLNVYSSLSSKGEHTEKV